MEKQAKRNITIYRELDDLIDKRSEILRGAIE